MSGAFPTTKKPRVLNFASNRPNSTAYTLSGKRSVKQFAAQYFSFSVQLPAMSQSDFMPYYSFLIKQKGSFDTFTFQYPLENQGSDKGQTDIAVNGTAAVGASQVPLDGFTNSTNGVLKAGDLIKFANHNKVYMVTADENSDGSGEIAAVDIEPPLQAALVNNEAVTVNQPSFTVALVQDDVLYATDASGFFTLSFDVREVL
jgi:hypothetical protein|tara:strand:+ start:2256 stop:2861 length:606 start_codon:yes stop_codon:yes gene_type:complete